MPKKSKSVKKCQEVPRKGKNCQEHKKNAKQCQEVPKSVKKCQGVKKCQQFYKNIMGQLYYWKKV